MEAEEFSKQILDYTQCLDDAGIDVKPIIGYKSWNEYALEILKPLLDILNKK
jgi:hypothetical protein